MAINFPNSPTLNEEFTAGDRTWIWDGTVWNSKETAFTTPGIPTGGATAQLLAKVDGADYNTEWKTSDGVRSFADASARATAIPSPTEGMTTFREDTDRLESWTGSQWTSPGDLVLIKSQTIGTAVTTVTVSNAFSADYDSYKIMVNGGTASVNTNLGLRLGTTATGYYFGGADVTYSSSAIAGAALNNATHWSFLGYHHSSTIVLNCELLNPFLTARTIVSSVRPSLLTNQGGMTGSGFIDNVTSYTDFTLIVGAGNLTGGTISVYGYRKS